MAAEPHDEDGTRLVATLGAAFVAAWSAVPEDLSERLSTSQLRVLVAVDAAEAATASDLARTLDLLPSSVTRLCDRLVAAGYVRRDRRSEDRRIQVVRLTQDGRAVLDLLHLHRREVLQRVIARMAVSDRGALATGLAAFADAATPSGGTTL